MEPQLGDVSDDGYWVLTESGWQATEQQSVSWRVSRTANLPSIDSHHQAANNRATSSKAGNWRVHAWEATGEVRDAWEAVVVPLLRRGLSALERLSLTC